MSPITKALCLSMLLASAQLACTQKSVPAPPPENLVTRSDFGRYAADDARLAAAPAENRVVLMGDSITEIWKMADPGLFANDHFVDRGIAGQTTMQMLLRLRPDVIDLHPAAVVILGGVNDIAQNGGPETVAMIEGNLASMAELAQAHHIPVVLCSITPADHFYWHPGLAPPADIHTINEWIRSYATSHHMQYLDYFSALATPHTATMSKALSGDGVHPTPAGFAIMRPLMEKAVAQAIRQQKANR